MEFERPQVISTIKACVVLHNFLCAKSEMRVQYLNPVDLEREDADGNLIHGNTVMQHVSVNFARNRASDQSQEIRKRFVEYFVSAAGSVP